MCDHNQKFELAMARIQMRVDIERHKAERFTPGNRLIHKGRPTNKQMHRRLNAWLRANDLPIHR